MSIKKAYSLYKCDDDTGVKQTADEAEEEDEDEEAYQDFSEYDDYDYYDGDYDWNERDNPCSKSYY